MNQWKQLYGDGSGCRSSDLGNIFRQILLMPFTFRLLGQAFGNLVLFGGSQGLRSVLCTGVLWDSPQREVILVAKLHHTER
jgi:hypothetical protein